MRSVEGYPPRMKVSFAFEMNLYVLEKVDFSHHVRNGVVTTSKKY
jgi:hypothetical protein